VGFQCLLKVGGTTQGGKEFMVVLNTIQSRQAGFILLSLATVLCEGKLNTAHEVNAIAVYTRPGVQGFDIIEHNPAEVKLLACVNGLDAEMLFELCQALKKGH
jgi:hypothetical protein